VSTTIEMRVGMSLYWVTLTQDSDGKGWTARWEQNGRTQEVWSAGAKREVMNEARGFAKRIEEQENRHVVPCPPTLRTGEKPPLKCMCGTVNPTFHEGFDGYERTDCCECL
jgi:hypothetical protein